MVCNIADTSRKTHALRLKRITARYSAALKKCKQTGDFRLPDRNIRGLKRYIGIEAFFEAFIYRVYLTLVEFFATFGYKKIASKWESPTRVDIKA